MKHVLQSYNFSFDNIRSGIVNFCITREIVEALRIHHIEGLASLVSRIHHTHPQEVVHVVPERLVSEAGLHHDPVLDRRRPACVENRERDVLL